MKKMLANQDRPHSADPETKRKPIKKDSMSSSIPDLRTLLDNSPITTEPPSPRSETGSPAKLDRASPFFFFAYGRKLITASGLHQLNTVQEDGSETRSYI